MLNYTIYYVGFDQAQQESISAILDLSDFALNDAWAIIDNTESDIVMIRVTNEKDWQFVSKYDNLAAYRIILVAENFQENFQDYWFLKKKDHSPPSLKVLVDLLNQIGGCLVEATAKEKTDKQKNDLAQLHNDGKVLNIDTPYEPNYKHLNNSGRKLSKKNYLFGLLLQINKEKKYSIVKLKKLPALYIAPEDNSYFFSGTDDELLQYCLVRPQRLNVQVLSRAKFKKTLKSELTELSIKELKSLIIYAIIHVSQGQLLEGHSAEQPFILKRISGMDEDSILSQYKETAELMYLQEGSLYGIADKLKIPLSNIFDFYNVCYLLGYINLTGEKSKNLDTDNSTTLGKFFKNFFIKK